MNKISDYTILEILAAAGTQTKKEGNSIVCRCPICKKDNDLKNHNCEVNSDKNNIFCFSDRKAYSRTELIKELNLYDALGIEEFDENRIFRQDSNDDMTETQETANTVLPNSAEPEKEKIDTKKEIIKETNYEFKDLTGKILYYKRRRDFSDKTKDIKYFKASAQGTVFYGLETLADQDDLNYILFCEGEKCCEALRNSLPDAALYDTAVLSFNSPSAEWKNIGDEAQDIILKKNITIFCDNDEPGRQKVSALCDVLKKPLKIVDFNDKSKGYDIADFLEENHGVFDTHKLKKYIKDYEPEPEPDFSQFVINNLIKNIKPLVETSVMSIKIQYQAIMGICGATSAGKTDFVLQVADEHAGLENSISLYLFYEGLENEIAIRADKKKMKNGNNVFAINAVTDFSLIRKFIEHFKDKKILIITDYVQALAWNLYLTDKSKNKNSILREYMTQIFINQNKLRVEFENVCFLNNYILNNDGMKEMRQQINSDPTIALGSVKEDGNVAFQLDYAYTILFSDGDEDEWAWKLGRYNKEKQIKKYIQLATAKGDRIGIKTGNPIYIWNEGRYELLDNENNTKNDGKIENKNQKETKQQQNLIDGIDEEDPSTWI